MTEQPTPATSPTHEEPIEPTPEQRADFDAAQDYVQRILTETQNQALYQALLNSRIQVAQLEREIARLRSDDTDPTVSP